MLTTLSRYLYRTWWYSRFGCSSWEDDVLDSLHHLRFTTPLVTPFGLRDSIQTDRVAELVRRNRKSARADVFSSRVPVGEGDNH